MVEPAKDLLLAALEDSGLINEIPPFKENSSPLNTQPKVNSVGTRLFSPSIENIKILPKTLKFVQTVTSPNSYITTSYPNNPLFATLSLTTSVSPNKSNANEVKTFNTSGSSSNNIPAPSPIIISDYEKDSDIEIISSSKPSFQNHLKFSNNNICKNINANIYNITTSKSLQTLIYSNMVSTNQQTLTNQAFYTQPSTYNLLHGHDRGGMLEQYKIAQMIEKETTEEEMAELEDQLRHIETYAEYMPKKLRYGCRHPDPVVETNSLSSVEPPGVWYTPSLPETLIDTRALSALQLEAVIYACQQHETLLPDGSRAGFLIGDGPGVGKGRTIAAIIYENYILRRKRAIWFSVSNDLKYDAERDLRDIDAVKIQVAALNKFKYRKITSKANGGFKKGIIFATYSSLIGERQVHQSSVSQQIILTGTSKAVATNAGDTFLSNTVDSYLPNTTSINTKTTSQIKSTKYNTRMKQLLKWCGKDFDGVIVFDECHKAKNLVPVGASKPTKTAQAVLELQLRLPKARIVYASATGATETKNMGYMVRLGLWGRGTPFQQFTDFIRAVERRGVGAMELVAMDMKLRGSYMARQLSFAGVSFLVKEAKLDENIIEIYDASVNLWSKAREHFQLALEIFESTITRRYLLNSPSSGSASQYSMSNSVNARKKHIWSQFWAAHQRFFKYLCLATKVALCVSLSQQALRDGKCVVIGLQSTGEARTLETVEDVGNELPDFISTAKGIFQSLIEKHFPDNINSLETASTDNDASFSAKTKFSVSGFHNSYLLNPDRPKLSKWSTARNSALNQATNQFTLAREEYAIRQRERVERETALKAKVAQVLSFASSKLHAPSTHIEAQPMSNSVESSTHDDKGADGDSSDSDDARPNYSDNGVISNPASPSSKTNSVNGGLASPVSQLDSSSSNSQSPTTHSRSCSPFAPRTENTNKRKNPFSEFGEDDDEDNYVQNSPRFSEEETPTRHDIRERLARHRKHSKKHKERQNGHPNITRESPKTSNPQLSPKFTKENIPISLPNSNSTSSYTYSASLISHAPSLNGDGDNYSSNLAFSELFGASHDKITLMKQELLAEIEELGDRLPPNTLDQLIEELGGPDAVAEMTGRKGRVVAQADGSVIYETRGEVDVPLESVNMREKKRFMDGLKKIAIISEAASSGISLQSDRRSLNQLRRVHITLELPWSADKAIQQFGRTHRSNQVSAPEYIFLISQLAGERRFASIVAKRLESLGALTHGDRRATESRDLSQFNFDNKYGRMALDSVMRSIISPRSSQVSPPADYKGDFFQDARKGLIDVGLITYEKDAYNLDKESSNMTKFLNRLLGLKVRLQNNLFQYFTDTLNAYILEAKRSSKWDMGILDFGTSGNESVIPLRKQSFHFATPRGLFSTQLWSFTVERGLTWEAAVKLYRDQHYLQDGFFLSKQAKYGKYAPILALAVKPLRNTLNNANTPSNILKNTTHDSNSINSQLKPHVEMAPSSVDNIGSTTENLLFNIYRPNTGLQGKLESGTSLAKKYRKIPPQEAQDHWEKIYNDSLTQCTHMLWKGSCRKRASGHTCDIGIRTRKYNVLAGSVLTVWNCLEELFNAGSSETINSSVSSPISASKMQIIRLKTKEGQRIVGVWIKSNYVAALVKILTRESAKSDTQDFLQAIL